jgi:outer membrane protein OmpA-like peptidoglycan-associated protein
MLLFDPKFGAVCIAVAALVGCSSPSQGANETASRHENLMLADEEYLDTLRDEFVEISGKDYVEFTRGSATLQPSARFRLERQAVWLRAYPMVSVRLVTGGDGMERIPDRRLAIARAEAVQQYLIEVGVQTHQISGVDIAPPDRDRRQRVTTKLDLIQPAPDE